jgi:hypothetical protein
MATLLCVSRGRQKMSEVCVRIRHPNKNIIRFFFFFSFQNHKTYFALTHKNKVSFISKNQVQSKTFNNIMTTTRLLPTAKHIKRSTTFLKPRSSAEKEKTSPLSSSSFDSNPLTILFSELGFSNQKSAFTTKHRSLYTLKSRKRSFCLCSLDETNAESSRAQSPKSVIKSSTPFDQEYGYFADYDVDDTSSFPSSAKLDMGF